MFSVSTIILLVVVLIVIMQGGYVVRQQHVAVIERLGKFQKFAGPGFHVMIPMLDRRHDVNLMVEDEHITFDAKTKDNVTIDLDVSIQYKVDSTDMSSGSQSGVYKSFYTLTDPVSQMRDYLADALRSQIPSRTLDEVFEEKDAIAAAIDDVVALKMQAYGYTLVTTLITGIKLPAEVRNSMNDIVASKNRLQSATNNAEAERVKVVTEAKAKAEAAAEEGRGIARQRSEIARGIRDSLDVIRESGVSADEANRLFEFTQWADMMETFATKGTGSTVVLPSDFVSSGSLFAQQLTANKADEKN